MTEPLNTLSINPKKLVKIEQARKFLLENQIPWTEHNGETHFILELTEDPKENINLWPTMGKFWCNDLKIKGKGLPQLLTCINKYFTLEED